MAGILIPQAFNNPSLPTGEGLAAAILADTGLKNWFQADYQFVTLSGSDIVSFNDRKTSIAKLTRAGENNGATLVDGIFGLYPGARFNSSESDRSMFGGEPLDLTRPFSWAGVATLRTLAASSNLAGTFTTSSVRSILNVSVSGANAGKLTFLYGTASCVGPLLPLNKPFAFACGFDGANVFLRVNGETVTVAAAGAPSSSAFALGALPGGSQFWDGDVGDIFICNTALTLPAGNSLLKNIHDFIYATYGVVL